MVFSAFLVATRAHAQAVPKQYIDLRYEIDQVVQGCPSAVEFRSILAKELGYDPYRGGSSMGLGIRVRSTSTGIEGVIDWSISEEEKNVGERRFSAQDADCRQMMASMGFVVAVQLQLMAKEQATELVTRAGNGESDTPSGLPPGRERASGSRGAQFAVTLHAKSFEVRSAPRSRGTGWSTMSGLVSPRLRSDWVGCSSASNADGPDSNWAPKQLQLRPRVRLTAAVSGTN
jgi:hypothetical protein